MNWMNCVSAIRKMMVVCALASSATVLPGMVSAAEESGVSSSSANREVAVKVFNRHLATFRSTLSGVSPEERAKRTQRNVVELLDRGGDGVVSVRTEGDQTLVLLDGIPAVSFGPDDTDRTRNETREAQLSHCADSLRKIVAERREAGDASAMLKAASYSAIATFIAALLGYGVNFLYRKGVSFVLLRLDTIMHSLAPVVYKLVFGQHVSAAIRAFFTLVYWGICVLLAYEWFSYVLSRFPVTRAWGEELHSSLSNFAFEMLIGIATAIPNLFIAVLIFLVAHTISRMLRPFFDRVSAGYVSFGMLDKDTAVVSRRLITFLIWLFAIAMAYPYLPGSHTEAFRGMTVLVGLMVSLGTSSIVGQAAAGLILMYTRSVRPGEYVRIGDHEGTISEVGLFSTRVRTGAGEEINLPNSVIINTATKNYSRTVKGVGYILDTTVTIGYDSPWRQVEAMLCEAARRTPGVVSDPRPTVFQIALTDFYPEYRLVCQAIPSEPRPRVEVLSALHANIQDVFSAHGVQIMSPHYFSDPVEPKIAPNPTGQDMGSAR